MKATNQATNAQKKLSDKASLGCFVLGGLEDLRWQISRMKLNTLGETALATQYPITSSALACGASKLHNQRDLAISPFDCMPATGHTRASLSNAATSPLADRIIRSGSPQPRPHACWLSSPILGLLTLCSLQSWYVSLAQLLIGTTLLKPIQFHHASSISLWFLIPKMCSNKARQLLDGDEDGLEYLQDKCGIFQFNQK